MGLAEILGFRKKTGEKPLSKRIAEAIDAGTIRKYMYINRGINSLLFYKKCGDWDIIVNSPDCIGNEIRSKLKDIFSGHTPIYTELYNHVRHEINKVNYKRNEEGCVKAVELEFCSSTGSFMTMEYQRILHERMTRAMEEEKRK